MSGISRDAVLHALGICAAVAVGSGAVGTLPTPLGPLDVIAGLAAPLGVLVGLPAVVGVGSGVALGGALRAPSWWILLDVVAYGGAALIGAQLLGVLAAETSDEFRSGQGLLTSGIVALVAATGAASILAWGAVIGWGSPFYAVAIPEFGVFIRSTVVVGGPLFAAAAVADWSRETEPQGSRRSTESLLAVALPGVWFVVATAVSLLDGGPRVQILGGGLAIAVLAVTYVPQRLRRSRSLSTEVPAEP
ncbi:hypothetical protein [Halovenus halobia]|uniref:hypothetical protein n=1 Tax=Halovenus halobia TaxID=3396622 RepID=UPI003F576458